ncbi:MAG: hypothetical protein Q8868_10630 [Bacteroidota bacterium]|nr:hypothetical protein [Bacteroidota bacterium]
MKNLFKLTFTGLSGLCNNLIQYKAAFGFFFIFALHPALSGQSDPVVDKCISSCGSDAKYVKDYRIQLGKGIVSGEFRFKTNFSLRKNTTYRFTMCTDNNSAGQLVCKLLTKENEVVISSIDENTGKANPSIDLTCHKSGIYLLCYDFTQSQSGSGIGIVSVIIK